MELLESVGIPIDKQYMIIQKKSLKTPNMGNL